MNNNILEFFVKMKDLMSGGLAKLATNAKSSFTAIQNGIDRTTRKNDELGNSFDKVARKAKASGDSISGFGRSLAAYVGIGAALAFGGGAIKSAMDYQSTKQSFGVLTGSQQQGDALAGGLNKLQQDTIMGPEVFKNAQTMMGFGISAEKVIPTMKMLGDVSMGNAEKLGALTLAFSQVSAGGKLTGQDLLQFINAGFNPLNEISKITGRSMAQLKDDMAKGAISSEMVAQAFESATGKGGLYNDMLNKLAETSGGKLQKLIGAFESLKIKVGEAIMPIASMLMTVGNFLMDHIWIVAGVAGAWATYAIMTNTAAVAQGILNAVMNANPIVLAITLIAGLIIAIVALGQKYKLWGENLGALWNIIKAFGQMAWIPFKMFGESSAYHIEKLWLYIKDFAENVINTFVKIGTAWELAKSGDFKGAAGALTASMETGASKELAALERSHSANQNGYINQIAAAQISMKSNFDKIKATGSESSLSASGIKSKGAGGSVAPGAAAGGSVASGITGSGPRVININGVTMKVADKIDVVAGDINQFMSQLEPAMQNMFLRILNSGASLQ